MSEGSMIEVRKLQDHVGESGTVGGWVETVRQHGKVAFIVLRDGTGLVQCVLVKSALPEDLWEAACALPQESCILVTGEIREEPRAPGGYEMEVSDLLVIGASEEYPIQPKEHGVEFLLDHRHLWLRSSQQRAGLRARAEVVKAIHDFMYERDFVHVDTPILTGAIGEHAGTLFATEYFGENAYLAQTGQLYAEAACPAFRNVYCFGPTFRAEKSKTRRHLTEFWMMEPEMAFVDSEGNMAFQEELIMYIVERALERCRPELELLERDLSKLEHVRPPFPRVSYTDAVTRLKEKGSEIEWGQDIGGADETLLSEDHDLPVFIFDYPKGVKAFYMKQHPEDPKLVKCDDLIAPEGYGEIIGGSQREDDMDLLLASIREENLPEEAYGWYLDLRRYGTFPHSGFGLGLERTVAWITGRRHIRELIPFPRLINRLYP